MKEMAVGLDLIGLAGDLDDRANHVKPSTLE
jgi:hypothetical protein